MVQVKAIRLPVVRGIKINQRVLSKAGKVFGNESLGIPVTDGDVFLFRAPPPPFSSSLIGFRFLQQKMNEGPIIPVASMECRAFEMRRYVGADRRN